MVHWDEFWILCTRQRPGTKNETNEMTIYAKLRYISLALAVLFVGPIFLFDGDIVGVGVSFI